MGDAGHSTQWASQLTVLRAFFDEEITAAWGDLMLIASCFVTGLLDSAVFNVWSCFVSMQTGNTIYAGLGVSGQPDDQPWRWCKAVMAIVSFIVGSFLFGHGMRHFGGLRRATVFGSHLIQAILVFTSASLGALGIVDRDAGSRLPGSFIVLLPITLLSLQSAGQCVMSRMLGYGEVPTVVLTSAYCDLGVDAKLFTASLRENPKRNRRLASSVMLFAGAVLGGFLTRGGDIILALWIGGSAKLVIALGWLFWKAESSIRLD